MKTAALDNADEDVAEREWDERLTGFLNNVASRPYQYDYFSLLRQLESVRYMTRGRVFGKAAHPKQERIRVRQEPSLVFPARNIQSVNLTPGYVEISINGFGLFGPSGPLPLHITEYAYERKHQHGDATWTGFANIFQHRLAVLFYRAWANAQSIISLDKNAEDRFGKYIACLNGLDSPSVSNRNLVHEFSRRYFAGLLMKQSRSAANLQQLLTRYFKVPVIIQTNVGYWVSVSDEEKTQVGSEQGFTLGEGLLLGDKLYDVQSKFRMIIGPLTLEAYRSFYKKGFNTARLREWVRLFLADEYAWDVKPVLMRQEVPPLKLGNNTQLGLSTWLGRVERDAEDLIVAGR